MNMTFIFDRTRNLACIKIAIALICAVLVFGKALAKDTPGATQTSYGVSASGAFQFSIPIVVPQGRNGVTPNLALNFPVAAAMGQSVLVGGCRACRQ